MIPATALILVVSTLAQVPGKPPDEARLHKMLLDRARADLGQKEDPRRVARGAWLASRHHLAETKDLLLARLERTGKWTLEWDFATHSLLDAMIQNRLRAPRDLLLSLARKGLAAKVVILLSYAPRGKRETRADLRSLFTLLPKLEDLDAHVWQAAGNLLLLEKDPTFAALLLEKISLTRHVYVSQNQTRWLRTHGGGQGSTMWIRPKGFPPLALYTLEVDPIPGDVVLAPGPTPVFYRRSVREESQFCIGFQPERKEGWDRQRLVWLYALAGSERHPKDLKAHKNLGTDLPGYPSACAHERDLARTAWKDLLAALSKKGIYKGKAPPLRIRWKIQDRRKIKKPPLAALPWMKEVELTSEKR